MFAALGRKIACDATMTWVDLNWFHDAELLARIGRGPLAAVLEMLAPALAQQNITLPDPGLPNTRYFAELAATLRSQPAQLTAYIPPLLGAGSQVPARESPGLRTALAQLTQEPGHGRRRDTD